MLVDEVTIRLHAGNGGRGAVAFNKVKLSQGPVGGDGGNGGNVYFEGVSNINALMSYASNKVMKAEDGKNGRGQFLDGRRGEDLTLKIPTGTTITNLGTGYKQEMLHIGQRILASAGVQDGIRTRLPLTPPEIEAGLYLLPSDT